MKNLNLKTRLNLKRSALIAAVLLFFGTMLLGTIMPALAGRAKAATTKKITMLVPNSYAAPTGSSSTLPRMTCEANFVPAQLSGDNATRWLLGGTGGDFWSLYGNLPRNPKASDLSNTQIYRMETSSRNIPKLTADQLLYLYGLMKKQLTNLIQFTKVPVSDRDANDQDVHSDKCANIVLVPVASGVWEGYQYHDNAGVGSTNRIVFKSNSVKSTGATGKITFFDARGNGGNSIAPASANFSVGGNPNSGGGPPPVDAGNVKSGTFTDVAHITVPLPGGGTEVYQKFDWDHHGYYFLVSSSDASRQAVNTWNNSPNQVKDPLGADSGKTQSIPFIQIRDSSLNLSGNLAAGTIANFQSSLNKLVTRQAKFYDFNTSPASTGAPKNIVFTKPGAGHADRAQIWFYYSRKSNRFISIFGSGDGNETHYIGQYIKDPKGGNYYVGGPDSCRAGRLQIDPTDGFTKTDDLAIAIWTFDKSNCTATYGQARVRVLADEAKFSAAATPITPPSSSTLKPLSCNTSLSNPLTWFICPLVTAAGDATAQLDDAITGALTINTDQIFETDPGINPKSAAQAQAFYTVWNTFRVISVAFLVVIGLIMVMSQALAVGPFDAYAVKKILPRLLIAVIFMSVSWYVMKFMITVTNDLGAGVKSAIESPFSALGHAQITTAGVSASSILVGGALIALGLLGLLSFAFTAFLAVLIAFLVIVLREMVIVFLVLVAPLAITCYILPNTQKIWKLWWESFSKGLLMFPLIMGFIALGHAFAVVSFTDDKNLFSQLIVFIAYFGPYFALPLVFKLAGGTLATLSGAVNDRGRGIFDRTKKYRQNKVAENAGKLKRGDRFAERNPFARSFNRTSAGLATGLKGNFGVPTARGKAALDLAGAQAATEMATKDEKFKQATYDDDTRLALMAGSTGAATRALRARGKSDAQISAALGRAQQIGFTRTSRLAAFQAEAANKGRNFTEDVAGQNANQQLIAMANDAAATTGVSAAGLIGSTGFAMSQNGRYDLAGLHPTQSVEEQMVSGWSKATLDDQMQKGTPDSIRRYVDHFSRELHSSDPVRSQKAAKFFQELKNGAPKALDANADIINTALHANEVMLENVNHNAAVPPTGTPVRHVADPAAPTGYRPETVEEMVVREARRPGGPAVTDW